MIRNAGRQCLIRYPRSWSSTRPLLTRRKQILQSSNTEFGVDVTNQEAERRHQAHAKATLLPRSNSTPCPSTPDRAAGTSSFRTRPDNLLRWKNKLGYNSAYLKFSGSLQWVFL